MNKRFFFTILAAICTVAVLTFSSFTTHSSASKHFSKWAKPEPIHISINYMDGTFSCSGAVNTTGTWTMDVRFAGQTFHCVNTLYAADGSTLVAMSHCNNVTMGGTWQIKSGTGIFANMKGNGSLMMYETTEEWHGAVR